MYVAFSPHSRDLSPDHSFLEQAHLRHYAELSAPPLTTSCALRGTMLQLGQRTFTHNTAGVPIIVACTIEDLINGLVGGEAFLGWVVW